MTDMRDARLKQALDHAPDAHMVPDGKTRSAILALAARQGATAPAAAPAPWWRRLLSPSSERMPWNAALATVLVASFVTLIWRNEDIPDAKTGDRPIPAAPVTVPVTPRAEPVAPSQTAPQASPAPAAKADVPGRQSMPAPARPQGPAADERRELARDRADAMANKAEAERAASTGKAVPSADMPDQKEKKSAAAADAAPAEAAAAPPPAPAAMPRAAPVPMAPAPAPQVQIAPSAPAFAPPPLADRPARMQESARAPAAGATGALAGSAASSSGPMASPPVFAGIDQAVLDGWSHARISLAGRTFTVERAQATAFAASLRDVVRATAGGPDAAVEASLRVELLQGSQTVGTLEVDGAAARWTQLRGAQRSFSRRVVPGLLQALQTEVTRLAMLR